MSKRKGEKKSENANQNCLENHEIRVACLEKCIRLNVCNHAYIPKALKFVCMPRMQIVETWIGRFY